MEPAQTDQPTPPPKKHRMTYAEWRKMNPNPTISPETEELIEAVGEIYDTTIKNFAEWFREAEAESRRKTRLARQERDGKPTRPKSPRKWVRTRKP